MENINSMRNIIVININNSQKVFIVNGKELKDIDINIQDSKEIVIDANRSTINFGNGNDQSADSLMVIHNE